jgi:hypothetical protein
LCIPIVLAIVALFFAMWFSPGRRWLIYFLVAMALLQLSGHMNIKRVLFLMPWLFLAMAVAAFSDGARYPKAARSAIAVTVLVGWIGIVSGKHYATTNLYEPWGQVARVVADDARQGATVVSENFSFFFYLDYQLGLQAETQAAPGSFLGEPVYQTHGYTILEPKDWPMWAPRHLGKVVLVNGSALDEDVQLENAIDRDLHARCRMLGEYRAAPDPAAAWKQRMVKGAAVLPYRVDVIWYDCTGQDR